MGVIKSGTPSEISERISGWGGVEEAQVMEFGLGGSGREDQRFRAPRA